MATSSSNASLVASTSGVNSQEVLKDDTKQENKNILSGHQVLGYAVGHIHNDICAALWFTYLLVFFESVLEFDPKISGFLLLVGQIADGIATPIVGLESDRNTGDSFKYGKRKTWHLVGTFLSACSFPMVFQKCYGGENASTKSLVFYYSMLIIIFQFAWASIQINHMSMATDLTPYSNERVKLTARRSCFTVTSNIIVYLFTWYVLHLDTDHSQTDQFSPDDASNFRTIVISLTGVGLIFSLMFHILVTEKPHNIKIKKDNHDLVDYSDRSNHLKWHHWFKFIIFYQVAALYMVSRLIVNLTQVFIPLYLHYSLDLNKESTAYIPLVIYCSGFFGSIIVELLSKKLSNVKILLCGSLISIISFMSIYYGDSENFITKYIYFISILIGLSNQIININSQSILNDMIGQNTASSAFVFGAMSFLDKFSNGFAVMLIQLIRSSSFDKKFYRYVLSFVCGTSSVLVLLILCTIIPHNFDTDLRRSSLNNLIPEPTCNENDNKNLNEQKIIKEDIAKNDNITQDDKQLLSCV